MAKSSFVGEILHFGAIRVRVNGSGNLLSSLGSLDNVNSFTMAPYAMSATTAVEPIILANLTSQRGSVMISTENQGDNFVISRIVVFIKLVASGVPQ